MRNRLRVLKISGETVLQWLSPGDHRGYCIESGIPDDAEFVNVRHAWPNIVEILIYSETYDVVPNGKEIPEQAVIIRRLA